MTGSYSTLESTQRWILFTENKMTFTTSVFSCVCSVLSIHPSALYISANKPFYLEQCDPVESVSDVVTRVPWWLECNKARFPYWYGVREPRLEVLYEALQHPEAFSLDTLMFLE